MARTKTKEITLTMTMDGHIGTAEIRWIEENQYSFAHYSAFISVPYQDSKWQYLFIYDKDKLVEATERAEQYLKMALSRCTLCG